MDGGGGEAVLERMPIDVGEQSLVFPHSADWLVGAPLSPCAAAWWGAFTEWCTATEASSFWEYNIRGPLIVFQDRSTGLRWQLHPTTGEFRDEKNRAVSWRGFLCRNPAVVGAMVGVFESVRPNTAEQIDAGLNPGVRQMARR